MRLAVAFGWAVKVRSLAMRAIEHETPNSIVRLLAARHRWRI
jgi:hypothetical protein